LLILNFRQRKGLKSSGSSRISPDLPETVHPQSFPVSGYFFENTLNFLRSGGIFSDYSEPGLILCGICSGIRKIIERKEFTES
jgi:hypothetical protein